jgi:hypothetical protein
MAATDTTREKVRQLPDDERFFDEWQCHRENLELAAKPKPPSFAIPTTTRVGRRIRIPNRHLAFLDSSAKEFHAYSHALRALQQQEKVYRELVYFNLQSKHGLAGRGILVPALRRAFGGRVSTTQAPSHPVLISGLEAWPRLLQLFSLGVAIAATLLAAGDAIDSAAGVFIGFFGLSIFSFANFAAWRRDMPNLVVGPYVAVIGMWGCLIIALAVGLNAVLGS